MKKIIVGSRDSILAVAQTNLVIDALKKHYPSLSIELVTLKTTGDKILNRPLDKIGGKGLFVKELDVALLEGRIDLAVHSLKDLPMEENPDLPIAAFVKRGDPRDCLVLPSTTSWMDSCSFSNPDAYTAKLLQKVGSSSLRRQIQLKALCSQANVFSVRGNIHTRLKKLDQGDFSSLILAASGLSRARLSSRISRYFSTDEMIPAAGQGILCVQCRKDFDTSILSCIHDTETALAAAAERSFVRTLNGGCSAPIAAYASLSQEHLTLRGMFYHEERKELYRKTIEGHFSDGSRLGNELAKSMLI